VGDARARGDARPRRGLVALAAAVCASVALATALTACGGKTAAADPLL
jgi:hypothetical protein